MPIGRCRYHGGKSTGAKNPVIKHGYYAKTAIEERGWLQQLLKNADELIEKLRINGSDLIYRRCIDLATQSNPLFRDVIIIGTALFY